MIGWRRKYSSNPWLQVTLNGYGVVEYEENLMGDPDWIVDNCGKKDLMIMCQDNMMVPAVPRLEPRTYHRQFYRPKLLWVNPR